MRITTEKMNLQNDYDKCNAKIIEIEKKNKMKCDKTVSNMKMLQMKDEQKILTVSKENEKLKSKTREIINNTIIIIILNQLACLR